MKKFLFFIFLFLAGTLFAQSSYRIQIVQEKYYVNKVSTFTAGALTSSSTLSVDFYLTDFSFYVVGGKATISSNFGSAIVLPANLGFDMSLKVPVNNASFDVDLVSGATCYYYLGGVK